MNLISDDFKPFEAAIKSFRNLVASTYGAWGLNVSRIAGPDRSSIDDGKKVIETVNPRTNIEVEAALRMRDVAASQHSDVGDGTTTALLLFSNLFLAAREMITGGVNEHRVAFDLKNFIRQVVSRLKALAVYDVDEKLFTSMAEIAMHGNKTLANIVGPLAYAVGKGGTVIAERSKTGEYYSEKATGYSWTGKCLPDPRFAMIGKWYNPCIVVCGANLTSVQDPWFQEMVLAWNKIRERSAVQGQPERPLVVITRGASDAFLTTAVNNAQRGWCVIGAPELNGAANINALIDIAHITGAKYWGDGGAPMNRFTEQDFGSCVVVDATLTTASIVPNKDIDIASYSQSLAAGYVDPKDPELQFRTSALNATSGVIYVPVRTETEFVSEREILEDGVQACMALWSGWVKGGGFAMVDAVFETGEAYPQFTNAVLDVFKTQWENGGQNADSVLEVYFENRDEVIKADKNTMVGIWGRPEDIGLIDPLDVVVSAFEKSSSVAIPLITTKYLLVEQ